MAKKDKKADKKDKGRGDASEVVEAVRSAVERTFQATAETTQPARERGRGLLDEVAAAAQRIRESFDDLRVLEDVRGLRAEVEALSRRVAALEQRPRAEQAGEQTSAAGTTAAASAGAAKKPSARKPSTTRSSAQRGAAASRGAKAPAAGKSSGTTTRARATRADAASSAKSGGSSSRPAAAKSPPRS